MANTWHVITRYLTFKSLSLTKDEELYLEDQKSLREYKTFVLIYLRQSCWLFLLATIPIYFLSPAPQRHIQIPGHIILSMSMYFGSFLFQHSKKLMRPFALIIQLSWAATYAMALHATLVNGVDINSIGFLSSLYVAFLIFHIIVFPFSYPTVFASALIHVGLGFWAWSGIEGIKPMDWSIVLTGCALVASFMFYSNHHWEVSEALWQYRSKTLLVQNKQLKLDAMEQELILARKIQDSFEPPQELRMENRYTAAFIQKKHGTLGGDWLACKSLPSGDLVVLVADATGKGVQAALVIHAVQSLWALATDDQDLGFFEPIAWIKSVNKMLLRLGKTSPHTLTLGMMVLGKETVSYYSAAHLPLYAIARNSQGTLTVIPMMGRGNILGLKEDIVIQPVSCSLQDIQPEALLLGTDGVFDKGSRTNRQTILNLFELYNSKGAKSIESLKTQDDKMLVVIKFNEAPQKDQGGWHPKVAA